MRALKHVLAGHILVAQTGLAITCLLAGLWEASAATQLKPTHAAPAGLSANIALDSNGAPSFTLELRGLGPGTYEIRMEDSNGSVEMSCPIAILDPTLAPDTQTVENNQEDSLAHQSYDLASRIQGDLPSGLRPENIRYVAVLDPGGNVLLEATL